ncbi:MAG: hypothetical protein ACI9KK_002410 [Ascidiaceihabitans sp.]|jgi:hypothetical protein
MLRIGPFNLTEPNNIDYNELLEKCLNAGGARTGSVDVADETTIDRSELTQRFKNLTIKGDAKIEFSEHLKDKTLNIIVDENLTFEEGATLRTNIHLKIRASTAIGSVAISSFGQEDGKDGKDRNGTAPDGKPGENPGKPGRDGTDATGTDGRTGNKGDDGLPGETGKNGGPGQPGERGRSIHLLVDRFQFGSSVTLNSVGSNGGTGGKGQDGGNGGDGKPGGRGGHGGDGGWLHRAGNAGRGGTGGDGAVGGAAGHGGHNGEGGDGGDVSVIVTDPSGIPWIGVVASTAGSGGRPDLRSFGKGGQHGVGGEGGPSGRYGFNTKPGRSNGKPNVKGSDGWTPQGPIENGTVRRPGVDGNRGVQDGPRPATPSDLIEFFADIVEGEINV